VTYDIIAAWLENTYSVCDKKVFAKHVDIYWLNIWYRYRNGKFCHHLLTLMSFQTLLFFRWTQNIHKYTLT